jgi:uncharacterized membrane protein YhaH (DUF805 family)
MLEVNPRGRNRMSINAAPPPLEWPHYGIGFGGAVRRGFTKYATFSGRASRSEYWWWALFTTVVFLALGIPALVLGSTTSPDGGATPGPAGVPFLVAIGLFYLTVLVPSVALSVRRLHDVGLSGWLVLLGLIPSAGGLVLLIFAVLPPSPAGAKYDPVRPYAGSAF